MEDSNYPIGPIDDGVANKMDEAKILTELRNQRDVFHKGVVVFIDELQAENEHLCDTIEATRQDIADYMDGSMENQLQAKIEELKNEVALQKAQRKVSANRAAYLDEKLAQIRLLT